METAVVASAAASAGWKRVLGIDGGSHAIHREPVPERSVIDKAKCLQEWLMATGLLRCKLNRSPGEILMTNLCYSNIF